MSTAAAPAPRSFPTAPVIVWVGLIVATLLSYWLGSDHGLSSVQARTLIIFIVAFVKVRFVGLYFMELRDAPAVLRSVFEGWCVVVCLLLGGLYLWA